MRQTIRQARVINRHLTQTKFYSQQIKNTRLTGAVPKGASALFGSVLLGSAAYTFYDKKNNKENDAQEQNTLLYSIAESTQDITEDSDIDVIVQTTKVNEEDNSSPVTNENNAHSANDTSSPGENSRELEIKRQKQIIKQLQEQLQSYIEKGQKYQQQIESLKLQLKEQAQTSQENFEVVKNELLKEISNKEATILVLSNQIEQLRQMVKEREDFILQIAEESKRREQELLDETEKKLAAAQREYEEQLAARLEEADEVMKAKIRKAVEEKEHELNISFNDYKLSRAEKLKELANKVYALEYAFQTNLHYLRDSFALQQLTSAVLSLQQILRTNGPFKPEVDVLKRLAEEDALVQCVLDSIPEQLVTDGVPKLDDLQDRFKLVKKKAIQAAYSPSNTLLGYAISKLFSFFIFEERGYIPGNSFQAVLSRAEYYLENGKLVESLAEIETIYEKGKEGQQEEKQSELNPEQMSDIEFILRDWVNAAKSRLLADQALEILEAHLFVLNNAINQKQE
jgi:hypothetical protein